MSNKKSTNTVSMNNVSIQSIVSVKNISYISLISFVSYSFSFAGIMGYLSYFGIELDKIPVVIDMQSAILKTITAVSLGFLSYFGFASFINDTLKHRKNFKHNSSIKDLFLQYVFNLMTITFFIALFARKLIEFEITRIYILCIPIISLLPFIIFNDNSRNYLVVIRTYWAFKNSFSNTKNSIIALIFLYFLGNFLSFQFGKVSAIKTHTILTIENKEYILVGYTKDNHIILSDPTNPQKIKFEKIPDNIDVSIKKI